MASVKHLFRASKKRLPMEELPEVRVADNYGFADCAHGRPNSPVKSCWWIASTEAMDCPLASSAKT
jgi:hypothetical protein